MMYWIYLLKCCDGTLYCGVTNDIAKRVGTHNAGKGAKYTKSRLPVELVFCEKATTKSDALRREWQIKKLSRAGKVQLVEEQSGKVFGQKNKETD